MISFATQPPATTPGHELNPDAVAYIPVGVHRFLAPRQFPHLPPPPLFLLRPLPPPPPLLPVKPLPFSLPILWVVESKKPAVAPLPEIVEEKATPTASDAVGVRAVKEKRRGNWCAERFRPPRQLIPRAWSGRRSHSHSHWRKKAGPTAAAEEDPRDGYPYPFGECTTLMIRNIPNRLSRSELVKLLEEHCVEMNKEEVRSEFDFVYLPVDFNRLGNKGYAFVNFTTAAGAAGLYRGWNGLKWDKFGYHSQKIRLITKANLQGKEKLTAHFEKSLFVCDKDDYLPVVLTPPCNGFNHSAVNAVTVGSRFRRRGG